jgi:hypothetical protein
MRVSSCSAANFPPPAPDTCGAMTSVASCFTGDAGAGD